MKVNVMHMVILTKVVLSIALVLIVRLAFPVPCNWGVFPRSCADDEVCGWNCWTLSIVPIDDCYQNATGCCMCASERRKCDCNGNIYYAYQDKPISKDGWLCYERWKVVDGERLPDDKCMESEPVGGP